MNNNSNIECIGLMKKEIKRTWSKNNDNRKTMTQVAYKLLMAKVGKYNAIRELRERDGEK